MIESEPSKNLKITSGNDQARARDDRKDLKEVEKEVKSGEKNAKMKYICHICNKKFSTADDLASHDFSDHCKTDQEPDENAATYYDHPQLDRIETQERKSKEKKAKKSQSANSHFTKKSDTCVVNGMKILSCHICHEFFANQLTYMEHTANVHFIKDKNTNNETVWDCIICRALLTQKSELIQHLKSAHKSEKKEKRKYKKSNKKEKGNVGMERKKKIRKNLEKSKIDSVRCCAICKGIIPGLNARKKKVRCKKCSGCLRADKCGQCKFCENPKMKKVCVEKKCKAPIWPKKCKC